MDRETFMANVELKQELNPSWRYGQTVFNTAYVLWPTLADGMRGKFGVDPFHNDDCVEEFLAGLPLRG